MAEIFFHKVHHWACQISNQINIDDDENHEVTHIEVDDSYEPESVEEYERLEIGDETFAVAEDEFESL